jgi:hypothetical protein
MATKKKRISEELDLQCKDIQDSPLGRQCTEGQVNEAKVARTVVPVFDGCTDAPYEQKTADTDIQKRVQEEIDILYPRARLGSEGILDGILRELIRARLSR